jgi:hypothetical protein
MGKGAAAETRMLEVAIPADPPVNAGDPDDGDEPFLRVSEMQVKRHRWAVTDPGRQVR